MYSKNIYIYSVGFGKYLETSTIPRYTVLKVKYVVLELVLSVLGKNKGTAWLKE